MLPEVHTTALDWRSAEVLNHARLVVRQTRVEFGDLSMEVASRVALLPGNIACIGVLEGPCRRDAHSMTCIDGSGAPFDGRVTAPARLINHACVPNLAVMPVPATKIGDVCWLAIAATPIEVGDELTWAYHQMEPVIGGFDTCLCAADGSPCVQSIGGWNGLDEHWKSFYRDMFDRLSLPFPAHLD